MKEYVCERCGETIEEGDKINLITENGVITLCKECAEIFEEELKLGK